MQVTEEIIENNFNPIRLTILIETKEEAQALYAIFNHYHNRKLFPPDIINSILKKIGDEFYVGSNNCIISNNITYKNFYKIIPTEKNE
jgi:hypothetical protein